MYFADLHIHSRFSRATSRDCDLPHLDWWARRKGIGLLGTGDFTHPAWRAELREQLAGRYEIVLANIIADVIIPLAPVVPAFLAPGGRFLCSGIIEHRAGDVADALRAAGWTILEERRREGWESLLAGMAGELG